MNTDDYTEPDDDRQSGALAIKVTSLTKRFGTFTAVENLSMEIRKGEFMGLLGPNGSGKSTALKCITGLIRPTEGKIEINGVDSSFHREAMRSAGCVVETPETYSSFTPAELMQYTGKTYGLDNREIAVRSRDVLEQVKLWEWRNSRVGKFSKGMRQRAMLAQSMLSNPDVLILDEPTSGLDPRGMIEMRQILSELKSYGRTLLISTHMLKEVSELCGSVTMINRGRTIASGDVNGLLREYVNSREGHVQIVIKVHRPLTSEFLGDLGSAAGVNGTERMGDYEVRVDFKGSDEDHVGLAEIVSAHGLGLMSMSEKGMDIERLYMELTKGMESIK